MATPFPVSRQSQLSTSSSPSIDQAVEQQWRHQQQTLKRFTVALPDLSNSFDPEMDELPAVLKRLAEFDENRAGKSFNTIRMLAFVLRTWDQHCQSLALYSFPVNPDVLLNWFKALKLGRRSINTISQYRAQLSLFHKIMAIEDMTRHPRIDSFFASLKKDQAELSGEQVVELQARPFKKEHLRLLISRWDDTSKPLLYRDLTVLAIAYGTLLRESEIGAIRLRHIEILSSGEINIERVSAKTCISPEPKRLTRQFADIVQQYISLFCSDLDPDDYLFSWLTVTGKRPLKYRQTAMSGMTIDRIYQRAAKELDMCYAVTTNKHKSRAVWSGHSSRVGALQDGYMAGMSLTQLIQLGDWKSNEMVLRYLRGLDNGDSPNMALQMLL